MKNFNIMLNFMAAIIIFVAVLGALFLGYDHLKKSELPRKIVIEYLANHDSIKTTSQTELAEINGLIQEMQLLTNEIQNKQIETISTVEEKGVFDKFYSVIVAVILVFAGFFGFKNITEIKQKALEDAKESAKEIAEKTAISASKTQFELTFTKEYSANVMNIATESFANIIDQENTRIYEQISSLENRIANIENNPNNNFNANNDQDGGPNDDGNGDDGGDDGDFNNNEPLNPFDNE